MMIRGLLHVIWCLFPLSCILQSVVALLTSSMLDATRPITNQVHEEFNSATIGSSRDLINSSPTSRLCRRGFFKSCLGSSSSSRAQFSNEKLNLALGLEEEDIAQNIRTRFAGKESEALADVIVELSTIRKRLTREFGGFKEEIENYLRYQRIPRVLKRLRRPLDQTIRSLKYMTDEESKNQRITILSNFLERELEDPEMKDRLTAQKARVDKLSRMNPSTSAPSEQMEHAPRVVGIEPLSGTAGTSHEAGPSSNKKNRLRWAAYQWAAEFTLRGHLNVDDDEIFNCFVSLILSTYLSMSKKQILGWLRPHEFTLDGYKLIEQSESLRRAIIRKAKSWVWPRPDPAHLLESQGQDWTRKRTLALQILVIESISGPHSKEALGVLQSLAQEDLTPPPKRALAVATQFQKNKNKPPDNLKDIFSLDKHIVPPEPEPASLGLLVELLDDEGYSGHSPTHQSEHAKKVQDVSRDLLNQYLSQRFQ
ncbi:hypothetical protein CROQUDRAFT_719504 [Cronartium quercuum f. sp. fusiforme G11]|uniref:Uncharacterized protein n=1 Tax=Cronartium quercuum f. sp. fusiforme G11 TaxID=708437 RepID=A0A9P6THL3_9BASI|nr:hypothetical protein CROQUDRAFT_719504 [Cronartium quercuum f. sp. fusiforme G11]